MKKQKFYKVVIKPTKRSTADEVFNFIRRNFRIEIMTSEDKVKATCLSKKQVKKLLKAQEEGHYIVKKVTSKYSKPVSPLSFPTGSFRPMAPFSQIPKNYSILDQSKSLFKRLQRSFNDPEIINDINSILNGIKPVTMKLVQPGEYFIYNPNWDNLTGLSPYTTDMEYDKNTRLYIRGVLTDGTAALSYYDIFTGEKFPIEYNKLEGASVYPLENLSSLDLFNVLLFNFTRYFVDEEMLVKERLPEIPPLEPYMKRIMPDIADSPVTIKFFNPDKENLPSTLHHVVIVCHNNAATRYDRVYIFVSDMDGDINASVEFDYNSMKCEEPIATILDKLRTIFSTTATSYYVDKTASLPALSEELKKYTNLAYRADVIHPYELLFGDSTSDRIVSSVNEQEYLNYRYAYIFGDKDYYNKLTLPEMYGSPLAYALAVNILNIL